ncbi:hypothetical protein ARMSODRAFT_976013 [Armillaria solidipes]|uniref:JmjC domain-containing protein n=1 Tax=Armillaria solidipes TaxID=1076256 RepID=A0A2H3BCN1_9AGAR|nr:hypothetical protein ARMSODRAFT_976013 [Armillaria solidipes]
MPEKPLEEPRCIEEAMSQSTAFNQTREMPSDIFEVHYPKYTTTFALASTAATFSYIHVDSMGVGTAVQVLTGKKIWFLFRRCGTVVPNGHIEEFFNDWKPGFIPDSDAWDAEMLILEPGTLLFMRPNTHHAVITLENCIVSGQHFYVSSCIEDTVVGFVHTRMWDFFITNVLHDELRPLLLRMMCYFAQVICGPGGRQALNGQNEEQYKEGVLLAVNCYKDIIRVASRDFVLYLPKGEQKVTPFQLAQASAKHFAAALIIYLKRVADTQRESAEAVDNPLDLECFQRGALAVLKELFDVGLPQEEIELLATKPGLRLLWRFPFIVQLKSEAFNQQLWDAQWEAMRQEADLGDSTSSEGSSGNKAHTVGVREDLTAKWRRRWRSEFVLGNCDVAIGEDDKCVRYANTKDNGEGWRMDEEYLLTRSDLESVAGTISVPSSVLHCLLKRMIAEHNANHEVGWFMWSCQDGSKVEEKVTKTGCRHGVLLRELNADHWILIEIDLDEKEFVIWNSLRAQDSLETYANITLGLSDIFEGVSEKGKDQWTTRVDDTSPKTSRVEDSGVYSCMYAWMTMSHGGFEHPQADMWTFDSIGSALRAEFLDYLAHNARCSPVPGANAGRIRDLTLIVSASSCAYWDRLPGKSNHFRVAVGVGRLGNAIGKLGMSFWIGREVVRRVRGWEHIPTVLAGCAIGDVVWGVNASPLDAGEVRYTPQHAILATLAAESCGLRPTEGGDRLRGVGKPFPFNLGWTYDNAPAIVRRGYRVYPVWCRVQRGGRAVNYRHESRALLSALRRRKREIRARLMGRRVHWVVRWREHSHTFHTSTHKTAKAFDACTGEQALCLHYDAFSVPDELFDNQKDMGRVDDGIDDRVFFRAQNHVQCGNISWGTQELTQPYKADGHAPVPVTLSCIDRLKLFKAEGLDISVIVNIDIEDAPSEERVLL